MSIEHGNIESVITGLSLTDTSISEKPEKRIPVYELLDKPSQRFVREVYQLSELTDDEYIAAHPMLKLRKLTGKSWLYDETELRDRENGYTDMRELLELHLLELQDYIQNGTGTYSHRTEFLVQKILDSFISRRWWKHMPDGHHWGQKKLDYVYQILVSGTCDQKLNIIHNILNQLHYHGRTAGPGITGIRDLWRYASVRNRAPGSGGNDRNRRHHAQLDFLKHLSGLKLQEK